MKAYLQEQFVKTFQCEPDKYLSCGGRFEVLGNHTDHNHGLCIAATCDLAIYAGIKAREDKIVRFLSEGFGYSELDLSDLNKVETEVGQPSALIRGIANDLVNNGYQINGFDIYLKSNIPSGAGVSSSAAFELLIAQVFNALFNESKIELLTLCQAGQFAEREFYGKMCGLLDQIGVAYGGLVYIDFKDITNIEIKTLNPDLSDYQFVIVNSGGSHAELSHLYKEIPDDMYNVANVFGKNFLRDVDYEEFKKNKADVIEKCGKKAYQRAKHFYDENKRVQDAYKAISKNNIEKLIKLINESRESSTELLENMCVDGKVKGSPLEACKLIMKASHQKAGVKINGGGFAGSVIALVPKDELKNVVEAVKEKYGKENVHIIHVRNDTPSELL